MTNINIIEWQNSCWIQSIIICVHNWTQMAEYREKKKPYLKWKAFLSEGSRFFFPLCRCLFMFTSKIPGEKRVMLSMNSNEFIKREDVVFRQLMNNEWCSLSPSTRFCINEYWVSEFLLRVSIRDRYSEHGKRCSFPRRISGKLAWIVWLWYISPQMM